MKEYFGVMTLLIKMVDTDVEDALVSFRGVINVPENTSYGDLYDSLQVYARESSGVPKEEIEAEFVIFCQLVPNQLP